MKPALVREGGSIGAVLTMKERFAKLGVDVAAGSPEQFASFLKGEVERWAKVIRDAGIKAD